MASDYVAEYLLSPSARKVSSARETSLLRIIFRHTDRIGSRPSNSNRSLSTKDIRPPSPLGYSNLDLPYDRKPWFKMVRSDRGSRAEISTGRRTIRGYALPVASEALK